MIEAPWAGLAFRVLGLGALGAVAIASVRGVSSCSRWGERATWAVAALVAVSALSAVFSIHRGKSLEAMLNLLGFVGIFLAAALLVRGARARRGIAVAELFAAVPVALVGIAQHFRPDLMPAESSYPGRALGSFGQPNRLGGFLVAAIPLAVALAFAAQGRWQRPVLLLAVLLLTACLVYTFSRGAWIALVAGMAALALVTARAADLRPEPAVLVAALLALALPAVAALPAIASRLSPRDAPATTPNLPIDPEREGSGAMRRAVWSGALDAASARPLVGWGIGAFREGYDRSKRPELKRLEAEGGRTADQAHSHYLETLSERGALGLAAFLLFAGMILAGGLAALGTGAPTEARLLSAGLLASVVALLVHGLLEDNLSLAAHGTLFAANAGLLASSAPGPRRTRRSAWLGGLGLAAAAAGLVVSGVSTSAAYAARDGQAMLRSGAPAVAEARFAAASRLAPWDDRYAIAAAKSAEAAASAGGGAGLAAAAAHYRRALASNPSDAVTRHELARLYLAHPEAFGNVGLRAAIVELRAALAQNPYYAEIRNDLGVALLRAGDREGAVRAFEAASEGRRDFVDPLLNLAALAFERGDRAEAARRIDEALVRSPRSERALAMRGELQEAGRP